MNLESKLTVFFDEPFWVGVFEDLDGKKLSVCKVVFGAEPTDAEIYAFILKYFNHLRFSPPVKTEVKKKADNPKRRQRNAHKQLEKSGVGTKSQQALQKQYPEYSSASHCCSVRHSLRRFMCCTFQRD